VKFSLILFNKKVILKENVVNSIFNNFQRKMIVKNIILAWKTVYLRF